MLLCFSHLRWDFVWQRPQHLLTRFARQMPVAVVEEPVQEGSVGTLRVRREGRVMVITPVLPAGLDLPAGFGPHVNAAVRALLTPTLRGWQTQGLVVDPIYWYYTPMALGAEPDGIEPELVVFDAMDELAAFRFAPPALVEREAELMSRADLVFTGGPSLYRARRDRHRSVHCFPSGVEEDHFAQARLGAQPPADLAGRPRPVIGFHGVLDERVDLDLLAAIADAHPEWTLALVGPTAKIDPSDLPVRPNVAWYGRQAYEDLPAFLAGFDVALLPFAMNSATRFISPTKTLEYLAGGKPVVSTPVPDVVDLYGGVVDFGETHDEVIRAIERALTEPEEAARLRRAQARQVLARHSWDGVATQMMDLMDLAAARKQGGRFVASGRSRGVSAVPAAGVLAEGAA